MSSIGHTEGGSPLTESLVVYTGHINNLYNTTFWALVQQGGRSPVQAEQELGVSYSEIMSPSIDTVADTRPHRAR